MVRIVMTRVRFKSSFYKTRIKLKFGLGLDSISYFKISDFSSHGSQRPECFKCWTRSATLHQTIRLS